MHCVSAFSATMARFQDSRYGRDLARSEFPGSLYRLEIFVRGIQFDNDSDLCELLNNLIGFERRIVGTPSAHQIEPFFPVFLTRLVNAHADFKFKTFAMARGLKHCKVTNLGKMWTTDQLKRATRLKITSL